MGQAVRTERRGSTAPVARMIAVALIGCIVATVSLGCAPRTGEPQSGQSGAKAPQVPGIDRLSPANRARTTVLGFMDARVAGKRALAESFLAPGARKAYAPAGGISLIGTSNPRLTSYCVSAARAVSIRSNGQAATAKSSRGYEFDVGLLETYTGQPYADVRYERLTLGPTGGKGGPGTGFSIVGVRPGPSVHRSPVSVSARGRELFLHLPGGKTRRLLATDNLPNEVSPQGAPPSLRFGVGKEGFTMAAVGPWAAKVAFGTWGTHGLIGWIRTAPLVRTWPVALDLVFEGTAVASAWSPSGRYLAVEIATPVGSDDVAVYDTAVRKLVKLPLHETFPPETYSLVNPTWRSLPELRVVFSVEPIPEVPGADPSKLGTWTVSIPAAKLKRE